MNSPELYRYLDAALLRVTAYQPTVPAWPGAADEHASESWRAWINAIRSDQRVASAVRIASPALAAGIDGRHAAEDAHEVGVAEYGPSREHLATLTAVLLHRWNDTQPMHARITVHQEGRRASSCPRHSHRPADHPVHGEVAMTHPGS